MASADYRLARGLLVPVALAVAGCAGTPPPRPAPPMPAFVMASPVRTLEEIQLTFDAALPQFHAMLLVTQSDSGRMALGFTIQPDGSATDCTVSRSSFDEQVTRALLRYACSLNFGARAVPAFTYNGYPINYTRK